MILPAIGAPKGGGAIRGIDEKLSNNPATGTASLAVPITTSPGRGGFRLGLELTYDAGAGNGPFGIGWHLSVPAITRKTDKGIPRYLDTEESDVFVLSGAEDLVPLDDSALPRDEHHVQRYRPRVEGLFARIERWTRLSDRDIHWRATTRENVTHVYGRSDEARIADPEDPRRVFSWLLEETRDDRGNVVTYGYKSEDGQGIDPARASEFNRFKTSSSGERRFIATAQRYLSRIRYGNRSPVAQDAPAPTDEAAWLFEVIFDHGNHDPDAPLPGAADRPWPVRPDPFSSYRAGFEVRTYRLCRRVLMFHRFEEAGAGACLVRSTDLTYPERPGDHGYEQREAVTYLLAITHAGYAGGVRAAVPSLTLRYQLPELHEESRTLDSGSFEGIPEGVDGAVAQWVDLDGEGIPGVLLPSPGGWYYKPNLGGSLGPPVLLSSQPVPADLGRGSQQLTDLDGDGRLELVHHAAPLNGFFTRTSEGGWGPFTPFRAAPQIRWNDPNLRSVDLDGDGHPDILITEDDVLVWYRSLARNGYEPAAVLTKTRDEQRGPAVIFADGTESIHLADMSGDGLVDIVRVRSGEVCYWPNLGHGRFGRKVTLDGSPCFDTPDRFDPRRARFADIDGSGTSDIVYLAGDGVALYLNQSGNSLAAPRFILSLPPADTLASVDVVDVLGQGTACLVWSSRAAPHGRRPLAYVDLMGGEKPHLLASFDNNLGAETRIYHAPSTRFYLEDKAAGKPWITRLPFPVHVVERVETFDHISKSRFVTRYAYHHGYFDGVEREFRGFGAVEQWDTGELSMLRAAGEPPADNVDAASYVPPVRTKTWFHTGASEDGQRVSALLAREYHREPGLTDEQQSAELLADTSLDASWAPDEMREACRALRGSILRQEVYAEDGSPRREHPYAISERSYHVKRLQARGGQRHAVFFVHSAEAIDRHIERDPTDPRVIHTLTLSVDEFGNALETALVAYRRRGADPANRARDPQACTLITYTQNKVTTAIDDARAYRAPVRWESFTYEITGPGLSDHGGRLSPAEVMCAGRDALPLAYELEPSPDRAQRRLIERERTIFRRDDLSGPLPPGEIESMGLPFESYTLAFTPGLVASAYGARVTAAMLEEGRYTAIDDACWIPSGRVFYSPGHGDLNADELVFARQHFFLPHRLEDPFGGVSTVAYDHDLLVRETRDPLGNIVTARNDWRVLQPALVTDPNAGEVAVAFDALGMVVGTAVMGKPGERLGDSLQGFEADLPAGVIAAQLADPLADPHAILARATARLVYDLFAYQRTRDEEAPAPAVVYTLARETHEADLAPGQKTKIQHGFVYSDGFGREIQRRAQAEPENRAAPVPRWTVSGWTIFDNKGNPVRKYEPIFSASHRFEPARAGKSSILFYDPVGRLVATLHPNHTYEKVVFDAWRQATWDVNDTVLVTDPGADEDVGPFFRRLSGSDYLPTWYTARKAGDVGPEEQAAAAKAAKHAATPTIAHVDPMGRLFLTEACVGRDGNGDPILFPTRVDLDIEGNQRRVNDARGREVMRYRYDMLSRGVGQASMEAGERWTLLDVAGQPIYAWDGRGHASHTEYDALRRPVRVWTQGADRDAPGRWLLTEVIEYGEGQPEELNLRTRLFRQWDGAGVATNEAYDVEGNLKRASRQLAVEYKRALDWSAPLPLQATYTSITRWDALRRLIESTAPDGSKVRHTYNEAGLLDRIEADLPGRMDSTCLVENVDYNERGQRTVVAYGNGARTTYTYDEETFRLARLATLRGGAVLQDLAYTYDPAGNIAHLRDSAQPAIYFNGQCAEPTAEYTYDALYRLIEATGREHLGQVGGKPEPTSDSDAPRVGQHHPNDGQAMGRYLEQYVYDEVGNIQELYHDGIDPVNPRWRRAYGYEEASLLEAGKLSNRLSWTKTGEDPELPYAHDEHGNLTRMPHLTVMRWDHRDRLQATSRQDVQNGGTPETTYYVYDASGQRVRKVTERYAAPGQVATRRKERIYLGGFEILREYDGTGAGVELEWQTLHVMADKQRVALVETRTKGEDPGPEQLVRYQLGNHLGSACLELDEGARIISYEEYYPYGSTSYQGVRSDTETPKRYRYTGKERDEESGLYYHEARYYAAWLGRWTSADPAGLVDGSNPYQFVSCSPLGAVDRSGCAKDPPPIQNEERALVERFDAIPPEARGAYQEQLESMLDEFDRQSREMSTTKLALSWFFGRDYLRDVILYNINGYEQASSHANEDDYIVPVPISAPPLWEAQAVEVLPGVHMTPNKYVSVSSSDLKTVEGFRKIANLMAMWEQGATLLAAGMTAGTAIRQHGQIGTMVSSGHTVTKNVTTTEPYYYWHQSSQAPSRRALGGNSRAGFINEETSNWRLARAGHVILKTQVRAESLMTGGVRSIDTIAMDPSGNLLAFEHKLGNSPYKLRQRIFDSDMANVGARVHLFDSPLVLKLDTILMRTPRR